MDSVVDFILFFGISIGLFIASALLLIKRNNTKANLILATIILLAVVMLIGRVFYLRYFNDIILFRIGTTVDVTVFIFGPLVFYFLNIFLFENQNVSKLKTWFFLPSLIYLLFSIWTYNLGIETYYNRVTSGALNKYYFYIEILGIITNSFFVYKSHKTIGIYKYSVKQNFSFNQNIIKFSNYFLNAYALCIFFWIISFINLYLFKNYSKFLSYDSVWIFIPVFIYAIGLNVLTQPEIFKVRINSSSKKNNQNRIPEHKILELETTLNSLLLKEKVYHKSDLSLSDLSDMLKISNNDLSWLINTCFNTNFYEYINRYRVEEFITRIKNGDSKTHTITAIALDVGFNSKSTFYKAFKLTTDTTPGEYIKQINNN
ncbi:helix-turn-helix domain-containing protein [Winogradskyella maritima]|uniref:Helix-turn-helix domain-containing protein n=1 Tax=Winogradskyella maritima TaxID=1517766 RepID=A0ABV8AJB7_9FLAO|nr:helix-turn-helix domain-containing protein [Winogradskyella maritima]